VDGRLQVVFYMIKLHTQITFCCKRFRRVYKRALGTVQVLPIHSFIKHAVRLTVSRDLFGQFFKMKKHLTTTKYKSKAYLKKDCTAHL
jgi:hypothetical protein